MTIALVISSVVLTLAVVVYAVLIAPARAARRDHAEMLGSLKRGDHVVTTGGICGRVVDADPQIVTLEIASGVHAKVLRSRIAGRSSVELPSKRPAAARG